jgi:hypothetical protein
MPFGGNNNNEAQEPAIVISGGTVYAWSQVGSPEEGLDCDFAPLVVEGGKVFSVGGGMGEMPSVPSNEHAKQPTALLIGLNIVKNEPVSIYDEGGKDAYYAILGYKSGNYLKVRTISLGYTFPKTLLKGSGISHLKVYAQAKNPFSIFNKYESVDLDTQSGQYNQGFTFGVNISF